MAKIFGINFGKTATDEAAPADLEKGAGTSPIGWGGVTEWGGFIVTDERMPDLIGARRHETYRAMVNDVPMVATGVRLFLDVISKAQWQIKPADPENPQAVEIAEAVEAMRESHVRPWHQIVRKQAFFKFPGCAVQEYIIGKDREGRIKIADIQPRPLNTIVRWEVAESGEVLGVYQSVESAREVFIPRNQIIYSVDSTGTESPEGMGLFRNIARACQRLKAFEQIEEVAFDTDLRGIPIARGPWEEVNEAVKANTITEKIKAQMRAPFVRFLKGHVRSRKTGMMMDSAVYRSADEAQTPSSIYKWSLELMRGESQAFEPMAKAIQRLKEEIAQILGVDHVMAGTDGKGSLALSKSKKSGFYVSVMSTLADLVETFDSDWLVRICEMNGWPEELWPDIAVEEIEDTTLEEVTQALESMARSGVVLTPADDAVREVFEMLGLTPPDPDQLEPPLIDEPPPVAKSAYVKWINSRRARARRAP